MKTIQIIIIFFGFFGSQLFAFEITNVEFFSRAFDLKTGKFLYTEKHKEVWKSGIQISSEVSYLDSEGKLIAQKKLDFTKNSITPEFEYFDKRTGYFESIAFSSQGTELKFKESSDSPMKMTLLPKEKSFVADAGFDNYIRKNWDKILKGETLRTNFAVPEHLDYYRFIITKEGIVKRNNFNYLKMKIAPENPILRLITTGIDLEYSLETRRLETYEGITNVNDVMGKKFRAKIKFEYPNGRPGNGENK